MDGQDASQEPKFLSTSYYILSTFLIPLVQLLWFSCREGEIITGKGIWPPKCEETSLFD